MGPEPLHAASLKPFPPCVSSGALELCRGLLYGFQLVLAVYNMVVSTMVEEFALWQNLQFPVCCIVIASSGNVEYVIALLNIFLV